MYSGTEPAVELKLATAIETESVFEVPLFRIPKGAVPVYDQELHAVVGYRHETTTGVFRLYDLEGRVWHCVSAAPTPRTNGGSRLRATCSYASTVSRH